MSDLDSAAEAMGVPPDLVSRSAAARAEASGTTTDEVLTAWSGGGTVAAKPAEAEAPEPDEAAEPEPEPQTDEEPVADAPAPAGATEPAAPIQPDVTAPAPSAPGEPPVLVGVEDNPWAVAAGAFVLFVAVALLALVGPSIPGDAPGARSSNIVFSEQAEAGQEIYMSLGCASCHTQMIRPVVADVGLGPVTLGDTDQVLGLRRYGPDLSDIGTRMTGTQMESIIAGGGGHPGHNLSGEDMSALVAYLLESATSIGGDEG